MRAKPIVIVGLGASAGGLEGLAEFFGLMPPDSGMAFVVVTHQQSGQKSMLPELLRKRTAMRLTETSGNCRVKPNEVYVAPPGGCLGHGIGVGKTTTSASRKRFGRW